jgi:hypothetical protein
MRERELNDGCSAWGDDGYYAAGWKRSTTAALLGGRVLNCTAVREKGDATAALVGGRGLRCWLGERRTMVALR